MWCFVCGDPILGDSATNHSCAIPETKIGRASERGEIADSGVDVSQCVMSSAFN